MAHGIDINTSRRTLHERCRYWKVKDKNKDRSEIVYEQKEEGVFYAKEISAYSKDMQVIGEVFMFQSNMTTIMTMDSNNISVNDIVEFDNKIWRVINIQRRRLMKQSQFSKKTSEITYIQLKG